MYALVSALYWTLSGFISIKSDDSELEFNSDRSQFSQNSLTDDILEFIEKLPDGLATPVSEHGKNLSGGQRQRLSIARAILKNAPVLILDEATSAIDNETEALIQRSINRFSQGRTTIMIAHRLSTIRQADCIYVMKEGGIFEFGPHEELLQRNGYYAHLWRLQTGEINSLSTSFELPT